MTDIVQSVTQAVDAYRERYYNLQEQDGNLEMEARFGKVNREGKSQLSLAAFDRVHTFMVKQPGIVSVMHQAEVSSMNFDEDSGSSNPRTIRRIRIPGSPEESWELKTKLGNKNHDKFGIRFGYSFEQEIESYPAEHFEPDIIRSYQRISFTKEDVCRIDLSIVSLPDDPIKSYEVEVEADPNILVSEKHRNLFAKYIVWIYGRIINSHILYDNLEFDSVIRRFNQIVGSQKTYLNRIDNSRITQARNIKYPDMVYGGLVGNNRTTYNMTHKTDGVRKFFFVHRQGVYLISGNSEVNKITTVTNSKWNGTLLDCELLPSSARRYDHGAPKVNYWLIILDTISLAGTDMTMKSHLDRLRAGQLVADDFKTGGVLSITTKSFKNLQEPTDMFNNAQSMFNQLDTLAYKTDGFMFVPNDTGYLPHGDRTSSMPLHSRRMPRIADIAKWKPTDEITIDFTVRKIDDKWTLYSGTYSDNEYKLIQFVGDKFNPYDGKIKSNELLEIANDDAVIEFEWLPDEKAFQAKTVRSDKPKPNRHDIALDNWGDIHNSIGDDVMRGQTLNFMRKYHNREKRELFKQGAAFHQSPCLLDIGTGRGGDISKMNDYHRIVMVEPNINHIMELLDRLARTTEDKAYLVVTPETAIWVHSQIETNNWTHVTVLESLDNIKSNSEQRMLILNVGGEHPEFIKYAVQMMFGRLADVVSMMFSLSFFWSSPEMLSSLGRTIVECSADYSHFIFATVDGPAVKELFDGPRGSLVDSPVSNVVSDGSQVVALGVDDQDIYRLVLDDNILRVTFPNTIVAATDLETEVQVEWLVQIDQLHQLLAPAGYQVQSYDRLTKEKFLSRPEEILTKLYYAGITVRGKPSDKTMVGALDDIELKVQDDQKINDIQPIALQKTDNGLLDMASMIDLAIS